MRAGFSKVRISPEVGAPLCGFAARQAVSSGIHDDLYARALVLSNDAAALAIVSVEVLAVSEPIVEEARCRAASLTGLAPRSILIAATHTHSGPVTLNSFFNTGQPVDAAYIERLIGSIATAIEQAWNNRFDAMVGIGAGNVRGIAANRRPPDRNLVDETVGVIKISDAANRTRALLVHYACHLTVLGADNTLVTADFAGACVTDIENALGPGGFAMYLNGAEGNVSVGHSPELSAIGATTADRTFKRAGELGRRLASSALRAAAGILCRPDLELNFSASAAQLRCRPFAPADELREILRQADEQLARLIEQDVNGKQLNQAKLDRVFASITIANAALSRACDGRQEIGLQVLRIGDSMWAAVPGELFVEVGLELRRARAHPVFVVGLAIGYQGYFPTRAAFDQGGYEVVAARFVPETAACIASAILEAGSQIFPEEASRLWPRTRV